MALRLGERIRETRLRRGWTQRQLGERVGISSWRVGQIERGAGAGIALHTLCALASALDLFLRVDLGRDRLQEPADAGHLKIQELMLRLARQLEIRRTFELPTKPAEPALSVDVHWRDDRRRALIINECWNTFGNVNASVRSTHRKTAEAEQLAEAQTADGDEPYRVAACWIVRDTRRNRELLARYPEVFAAAFPASSSAWVKALTSADAPVPTGPGLVWSDLNATRIFAWRKKMS